MQYVEKYLDQIELELNIDQIKQRLEVAKQEWNQVVQNGKQIRKKEILDFHYTELGNKTTEEEKKKR